MGGCTEGFFTIVADGAVEGVSDMVPALLATARGVVIALVTVLPATVLLLLACRTRSRKTLTERRGLYRPN
jgi:hypothetical protein